VVISDPSELRSRSYPELEQLAADIRAFLIENVTRTGGHLGPNLGVVELSIALHRVFDSPRDSLVWDTGHQSYVHKILTGRAKGFDRLRQKDGISGYPSRRESEHDIVENSHASTALSWADGIARARLLRGETHRHTVAVIGDGALTGGMAWEAINNIAASKNLPLVIVVNDNERSYSPTVGGLANHLATLRATKGYEHFLQWGKQMVKRTPVFGDVLYLWLHGMKRGIKDMVAPQGMFEDLGLKYLGPVDGHDIEALEKQLQLARDFGGPVIVHAITEKGRGYAPAVNDVAERFHAVGVVDAETGLPTSPAVRSWTNAFSDELIEIGRKRSDVVAITAAMLGPTGLDKFKAVFPHRTFDVGIAEQHATTSAAGMAFAGLHPVVAVYATFLNRAFDQLLMDVALHKAGVTFVLDRAGVTGDDGASHNGMWDLALLQIVPGLQLAAPRDEETLRESLREAVSVNDAPTVVRFPKGALGPEIPALTRENGVDVLYRTGSDVLVIAVGATASIALAAAQGAEEVGVTVIDPRWVKPLSPVIAQFARDARSVIVVEDGVQPGGVASVLTLLLAEEGVQTRVRSFAIPLRFLEHAKRAEILSEIGLTAADITRAIRASVDVELI
jgi:1-deoxy-D-xylulose-5-phosphate synthase